MITSFDPTKQADLKVTAKHKAQELLLHAMQIAFVRVIDGNDGDIDKMTEREKDLLWEQMDKQMARVEKAFGYEPRSFQRGC